MENSNFISASELTGLINSSIHELHDLLIQCYDTDYYLSSYTFSTSANVDSYALPSDFYKMRGLDMKITSTDWDSIRPFSFADRNLYQNTSWSNASYGRYRLMGSNLVLMPKPTATYDSQLWYIPSSVELSASGDTFDGINGFEEFVVIDTAIKMRVKEESDITALALAKKEMQRRIEEAAQNRDAGFSEVITDVNNNNTDYAELRF